MKLNKRYVRSIKADLSFYVSATILTMVTLLMFYLFYIAGTGINKYGDDFFSKYKREDATFSTYAEIPDEELSALETKYGVTLEKERFAATDEDEYRVRVFSPNEKIDLFEIQYGHAPEKNGEIIISAGYAVENNVKVGDKLAVNGKEYAVAGTFLRPDYLYMVENLTDDYKNVTTFLLAYMTPEEFEDCFGGGSINYKVIYGKDTDQISFRKEINENYYMASYLSADSNMRITFVHEQADMFIMSSWFILVIFPLVTVALICILLGRRIRAEQKLIGTLSAMGYEKSKLMRHYSLFAAIPGVIGGLLTSVCALILSRPFGSLGLADYEPMKPQFTLPVWVAVAGVIVPTLIYWLAAMLRVRKLLKEDTVKLLAGQVGNDAKSRRILTKSKKKVGFKYAIRQLVGNPGRSFVIFLGIFLGAMIMAFGYSFIDSVKAVGEQAHGEFGTFKYEYVLNKLEKGTPDGGEAMMILPFEDGEARRFSFIGLDGDATLWNLTTTDGKKADIENGFYISTLCEAICGVHKGDEFTFRSIATLEEHTVKIDGVIRNGYQNYIVSSREKIADITGLDKENYNAILSDRSLDLEKDKVAETITDNSFEMQMRNMLNAMSGLVYAFIGIGMIVCVTSLYATVNTMLSENRHNISMLKVLGFENGRIHSMIISSNHLLLIPGIAFGIAAAYGIMAWYCAQFVEIEKLMIPATLKPFSIILTVLFTAACYFVSLLLLRRKVDKTNMVEALKDGRE
ncbi:MAG: FtsX-like permease family protein [Clostridia bacterium]|nr:FtsX-like permease family protein [Clostridia bacterium]